MLGTQIITSSWQIICQTNCFLDLHRALWLCEIVVFKKPGAQNTPMARLPKTNVTIYYCWWLLLSVYIFQQIKIEYKRNHRYIFSKDEKSSFLIQSFLGLDNSMLYPKHADNVTRNHLEYLSTCRVKSNDVYDPICIKHTGICLMQMVCTCKYNTDRKSWIISQC